MTTIPTDKTTYAITDDVIRQTECNYKFGDKSMLLTLRFMGEQAGATQLAMSYRESSRVNTSTLFGKFNELSVMVANQFKSSGQVTSSQASTKKGTAVATITIDIPYDKKVVPEVDTPDQTKQVTWAEKSTKYQFPLEVYAGDVESNSLDYACAGDYQGWLNENGSNAANYKSFMYELSGSTLQLSARTLDLAKKHYAGIESVERAYPEVIRTTIYQYIHGDDVSADGDVVRKIDEAPHLYEIDNSISTVWKSKFDGFSWLKASYDVDIQPSEYEEYWNATVTESWIGISEAERGAWDPNLYGTGTSRWNFYTKDLSAT